MQKSVLLFGMLLVAHFGWAQSLKPIAAKVYQAKQQSADFSKTSLFSQAASVTTRPELAGQWAKGLLVQPDREKIRDLRGNAPDRLEISLPDPDGGALQLELVRAQVFSQEFTVRQASDRNAPVVVDPGLHYWGIVKDQPHTLAGISIFESDVVGIVYAGTEKLVFADLEQDPSGIHIIYRERDLASRPGFECMSEMLEDVSDGAVAQDRSTGPDNCVRMYMEADYTIFQNKGSVAAATTYIESFFSQVALLYANESVNMVLNELLVWDVADPYTGPSSSNYLYQFRDALAGVYNGDLAHLVGFTGGGGIAYVDVLCNSYYGVGYSGINTTYSNVPTYSWTVEVVTHEIGHNLGSQHTHACAWNGNNTAIDGCGPAAGYSEGCNAALLTAGTIMSYCHLVSGVGIDLNLGFGPQPGDRIRNEVYNAACLAACGGGGPCSYGPVNSQNFDGGWGIWTDGGTDCARINSATYANSGTYSIRLRDNTGTSLMSTTSQNWTAYEEITVEFSFITVSFDNSNEDFWLQLSNNGGSSYTTVGDWNYSVQFTNNVRGTATVVIPGPFASNSRLRIRADASADDDQVYIDDVVITGCSSAALAPNNGQSAESRLDDSAIPVANIDGVQISPNPARDVLNIRYTIDADALVQLQLTDLTGKTVWFQDGLVQAGEQSVRLELNTLPAGLYVFNLVHRDQVYSQKVVVTR